MPTHGVASHEPHVPFSYRYIAGWLQLVAGAQFQTMRETSKRSAQIRRRLTIGILVLAFVAQLLDAVNGLVALMTSAD
jgi:hypothetical protein